MTIYLITDWSTIGITTVNGASVNPSDTDVAELKKSGEITQYFRKGEWYRNKEWAVKAADKQRVDLIAHYKTEIKRLKKLSF